MINAARAMKPLPTVISLSNAPVEPMEKNAPPSPAKTPPRSTACQRTARTLMPTVSAASGCSPTARTRSPHLVRKIRKYTNPTEAMAR